MNTVKVLVFMVLVCFSVSAFAESYNEQGVAEYRKKNYTKSAKLYNLALSQLRRKHGVGHIEVAIVYHNLGSVYRRQGIDSRKAIGYFQKALKIGLKKLGPQYPSVMTSYTNAKSVNDDKSTNDKIIKALQRWLNIMLKKSGPDSLFVSSEYIKLANAYCTFGKYDKSITNYQKSLKIMVKKLGHNHAEVLYAYVRLSSVYEMKSNKVLAIIAASKVLINAKHLLGETRPGCH